MQVHTVYAYHLLRMLACYYSVGLWAYFDYGTRTFCKWCAYI